MFFQSEQLSNGSKKCQAVGPVVVGMKQEVSVHDLDYVKTRRYYSGSVRYEVSVLSKSHTNDGIPRLYKFPCALDRFPM
jgi:hypothetical protein